MSFISGGTTIRADINQALIEGPSDIGLIGAEALPLLNVPAKSGVYLKATLAGADLRNADALKRDIASEYATISRSYTSASYTTQETGLTEYIDDSLKSDLNRFFALEASSAKFLLRQLKLSHEKRVSDLLWATSTPFTTADQTRAVAYTEGNLATINAPADVAAAKLALNKLGYEANAVLMSANVFERIRRSTLLQNMFFGVISDVGPRLLSEDQVAAGLGVDKILIGRAARNTANKNLAYSGSFIVPDTKIIVANLQGGEFTAGGVGRTLVWADDAPGGFISETYRDDARRSNVLRVRMNTAEVVIDANAAVRITTDYV
jgi:hypothetical protein